ncbi:MAG TPA: PepSY domain-containing protein [Clostridiaceae bacterium]|nr:PepSY domain-containing protein [Clostridiaceae bacterium]
MRKKLMVLSALIFVLAFAFACSAQEPAPAPAAPAAPTEETPPATTPGTPAQPSAPDTTPDENRSIDEVKRIALDSVGIGNGVLTKYELKESEDEDWTYVEFEIQVDSQEHDIDVDRRTGSIREKSVEDNRNMIIDYSSYIGLEEAERIALERVGETGSLVIEFELEDVDDNDPVSYDFEILAPSGKFEVQVDAMNGEVLKFEKD